MSYECAQHFQAFITHNSTFIIHQDWTAVRPVFLTNSKNHKEVFVSEDNQLRPNLYISRRNLAAFMLNVLEKNLYLCQAPVVSER
jgi:hypothetical protein